MITEVPAEEVRRPAPHADHAGSCPYDASGGDGARWASRRHVDGRHGARHAQPILVAALLIPILLWSPIGREVIGFTVPAPFGLRDDVFSLILSLPVIFYSA